MKLIKFIGISILFHSLIFLFNAPEKPITQPAHIVVNYIGKSSTKIKQKTEREKEKEKIEKKEEPEDLSGQVVDLPPDASSERPEEAEFLSETDHKVERETVSRHSSLSNEQSGHEKTQAHDLKDSMAESLGTDQEIQDELRKRELPKIDQRDKLAFKKDKSGTIKNDIGSDKLQGEGQSLYLGKHDKDAKRSTKGAKEINLFPDQRTLSRIISAPFADSVEEVEEAEGTFLNTYAFKYASFYNRVKRDVANMWHPMLLLRQRDPTGNIYGGRNRVTVVDVILDKEGIVLSVNIRSTSGVDFLDQEAKGAFWRVQQFPNPPKGMIKDGKIRFNFGFNVSFNRRTLF